MLGDVPRVMGQEGGHTQIAIYTQKVNGYRECCLVTHPGNARLALLAQGSQKPGVIPRGLGIQRLGKLTE